MSPTSTLPYLCGRHRRIEKNTKPAIGPWHGPRKPRTLQSRPSRRLGPPYVLSARRGRRSRKFPPMFLVSGEAGMRSGTPWEGQDGGEPKDLERAQAALFRARIAHLSDALSAERLAFPRASEPSMKPQAKVRGPSTHEPRSSNNRVRSVVHPPRASPGFGPLLCSKQSLTERRPLPRWQPIRHIRRLRSPPRGGFRQAPCHGA